MSNQALIDQNEIRWSKAVFNPNALKQASSVAKRLVAAKDQYISISNKTGVPWFIIAVIHEREASQRWDRNIAQGDRWDRCSTHVPKGRGPFPSFESAAYDALVNCAPYASKWHDWSAGGALTLLELYNGLGYEKRGIASPYLWAGTNQYTSGKYVADGVFDVDTVDSQLGCAVLLDAMHSIDPTVSFDNELPVPKETTPPDDDENTAITAPKAGPVGDSSDTKPATQSTTLWASIVGIITALGAGVTDVLQKAVADWKTLAVLAVAAIFGYVIWERLHKSDIKGIV